MGVFPSNEPVQVTLGTIDDVGHGLAVGFGPGGGLQMLLELWRPFLEIGDTTGGFVAAQALGRDDDGTDTVELVVVDALDRRDGVGRRGEQFLFALVVKVLQSLPIRGAKQEEKQD